MRKLVTVALLLAGLSSLANAQEAPEQYWLMTEVTFLNCGIAWQLENALAESGSTISEEESSQSCNKDAQAKLTHFFGKAKSHLQNNPTALAALKRHYAFWLTAMDGIQPQISERVYQYEVRQSSNSQMLQQLLNELKIEAS